MQVIAIGKAAEAMVRGAASALGDHPLAGILVTPGAGHDVCGLTRLVGEHPVPGEGSHVAARAVLQELDRPRRAGEWVLFLISGGGSALAETPVDPLTMDDVADVHRLLVGCGADITEMNAVRKHLSAVKGGRLALAAAPARCLTLMVSDVPDGRVDTIASGPTLAAAADERERALAVVRDRSLDDRLPERVRRFLTAPPAVPPADHGVFERGRHAVVMDNALARATLVTALAARGVRAVEDVACDDAPVGEAIEHLLARLDAEARNAAGAPVAVVSGGELSCPVTGDGVGGRNLHFALAAAERIAGRSDANLVASIGTDGLDGNAPSAGAAVDGGPGPRRTLRAGTPVPNSPTRIRSPCSMRWGPRSGWGRRGPTCGMSGFSCVGRPPDRALACREAEKLASCGGGFPYSLRPSFASKPLFQVDS